MAYLIESVRDQIGWLERTAQQPGKPKPPGNPPPAPADPDDPPPIKEPPVPIPVPPADNPPPPMRAFGDGRLRRS